VLKTIAQKSILFNNILSEMKKLYFTAIIAVIAIIQTFAQAPMNTDANIFGDVQSNGDHISFATILVQGTNITTATDATGHYKIINLDEGDYTIIAQTFGYKRSEQKVTVVEGKTVELNFELEEDLIGLEEVVVSSDRDAVDRKSSNIIVNSLNKEVFNVTNSISLVEGLDFTPGLRTENNCQNCGFTQVRMNGLDGPYSQILINSRPIFSGLAGVYGLELFPTNMIEKVEVVRGGGSAMFGGNAIAGTINIITKEPISNSFSLSSNISAAGLDQEELSFDRSLNFNASVVSDDLKSGLSLFGLIRDRDPYDDNGDGFSEEILMENQTIGISTFYKPTSRTKLSLDLYRIHEFRRGGDQFEKLPHETLITEQLEHDIFGAGFAFDILTKSGNKFSVYTAGQTVDRASYYGAEGDRTAYGQTDDISMNSGLQYTGRFDFISNSKLILGADHSYNQLEDIKLGADGADNTTISDQAVNTYGSFVQYELDFNIVKLSAGVCDMITIKLLIMQKIMIP
jgi:outer membrane receptor for ferrienterochelin and colicins